MGEIEKLLKKLENDGFQFQSKEVEWGTRYVGTKKPDSSGPLGLGILASALGSTHKVFIGWFEAGNPSPERFQHFLVDAEKFNQDGRQGAVLDSIIVVNPEKFDKKSIAYLLDHSDKEVVKLLEFRTASSKKTVDKEPETREVPRASGVASATSVPSIVLDIATIQKAIPQPSEKERVVYAWEVFPEKPLGPGQAILVSTQERGLLMRRLGADHLVDVSFKWETLQSEPRAEVDSAGSSLRIYDGSSEHRLRHKDAEFIASLIHHLKWGREGYISGHMRDLGFDQELQTKCTKDITDQRYREAITSAFYVLESRIRRESMARSTVGGKELVEHAFNAERGQIPVGIDSAEKEGVYFLFRGAFQAFRNSATHRDVLGEATRLGALSQIGLVNLLLALTRQGKEQFERGVSP